MLSSQGRHRRRAGRVPPWTQFRLVIAFTAAAAPTFRITPATAQRNWRPAEITIAAGLTTSLPQAFQPCGGRSGTGLSARIGVHPVPVLVLSVSVDVTTGPTNDGCGIGPPPPSPGATGHFETVFYDGHLIGYPVYQTGLRLGLRPFGGRKEELELAFALERAWRQHLWVPVVGLSDMTGRGPIRFLIEGSVAWYTTPLTVQSDDLDHGVLLRSNTEKRPVRSTTVRVRVGVVVALH